MKKIVRSTVFLKNDDNVFKACDLCIRDDGS